MQIERRFTTEETGAYGALAFRATASEIRNPDGSTVFKLDHIDIPEHWTQLAIDILAQKYFRKAGVPQVHEDGTPVDMKSEQARLEEMVADLDRRIARLEATLH